ncbi:MAG: glycosyltransferase family 92 protein [Rhodomicrobium sp.]|nr:glycosyltransferase family 92 protein [Rhodomicrobium sp.]
MLRDLTVRLLLLRSRLYAKLLPHLPFFKTKRAHGPILSPVAGDPPQNGIAIVTIVKDEASYFPEWLEFHFMLGVRHIYVYDNGSTDNTPEVLAPYVKESRVTVVPWRNFSTAIPPQSTAYAHSIANFGAAYRWMAFIDIDEFMFPAEGSSLDATLAEFAHQPAVSMVWLNFGPSGHEKRPDGLVIANYTERAVFPPRKDQYSLLRYKNVVDPCKVWGVNAHACYFGDRQGSTLINDRGIAFPSHQARDGRYASIEKLRLNHYFTRSKEEIAQKIAKGRVSRLGKINPNVLDRRLAQYEIAKEQDVTILRFVPELQARLKKRQPVKLEQVV